MRSLRSADNGVMRWIAPDIQIQQRSALIRAACLVVAAMSLGLAIHVNNGVLDPVGILWLSVGLAATLASFAQWPRTSRLFLQAPQMLPNLVALGIYAQIILLLCSPEPGAWRNPLLGTAHFILLAAAMGLCQLMYFTPELSRRIFPGLLLVFGAIGFLAIHANPHPKIDVWNAQMAGLRAMTHGSDPWSSTIADVYHRPDLYAPGTVRDGVAHIGFPYPPLTVLLDLPGYLLAGDLRYGYLLAMILTAALIASATPGRLGPLLGVLFLFTPRAFHVLQQGWTEPTVALLLAATVWCARKRPNLLPWALGLFLVSKQYAPLAAIPAILLARTWKARAALFGKAALIGAVVSLPLALWNTKAFLHSTLLVAAGAKFRMDSLCYLAYFANLSGWTPTAWVGSCSYIAGLAAAGFALRKSPRTPAGFCTGVSLAFLCFFAVNKFAFCNYYYFIIAGLCTAAGAEVTPIAVEIKSVEPITHQYSLAA